ncbi:MAG TPA: phosphotransferase [Segetibacter sp.]
MKNILQGFGLSGESIVVPIKQGLIHNTFRATDDTYDILLQKINDHIFKNVLALQQNYLTIYNHFQQKTSAFKLPELITTKNQELLLQKDDGEIWRAFSFISNSFTYESITDTQQAFEAAQCYGKLTAQLTDLPFSAIEKTIPHFHDISYRFNEFTEALGKANNSNKILASNQIETIIQYSFITDFYQFITYQPHLFRQYILHHDCKISNILFDKKTNEIICPVDLDTTMSGYFFSDLGDMIRSVGNNLPEDSKDLEQMKVNKEIIEAVEKGYSSAMATYLTPDENKWLPYSGHILTYMQALRFLTDFLNGSIYYKINYPLHNLDRTNNQLRFLQLLMEWREWPLQDT